jgi:rhodanese-related sulfurtransferase
MLKGTRVAIANRRFKDAIYEQFARIGKAVASPKRLELLDLLSQGPRTVDALAREAGMSTASASQHLQVLRAARLLEAGKEGPFVRYRLADDAVGRFFLSMRSLAEDRLAEVELIARRYMEGRKGLEPVDREVLRRRVRDGQVMLIDVRPAEEFRAGHIPGAISIPLRQLESRLSELPKEQEIVAYCRGPYCVLAVDAVERLSSWGYRALRLEDGVQEWRALGHSIETGAGG